MSIGTPDWSALASQNERLAGTEAAGGPAAGYEQPDWEASARPADLVLDEGRPDAGACQGYARRRWLGRRTARNLTMR
jgi:hypothetical protein